MEVVRSKVRGRFFKYCFYLSKEYGLRGWVRGGVDKVGFVMGIILGKMFF